MANTIELAKKYVPLLDEVYKENAKTAVLESDSSMSRAGANTNEIVIPKIDMDGLADYSRNSGYVKGDVSLTWETTKFNYERGRMFTVDAMDNEETQGIAFGKLAGEFIRTKVVPELDAFRFATFAGLSGIGRKAEAINSGDAAIAAIRKASDEMDEAEVPMEDRHLFITPTIMGMIEDMDTYKSKAVMNRFSSVVKVPQSRFYTAIALMDGSTSGEESGGFIRAAAGYELTAEQPSDWSTNYKDYYTKSGSSYSSVTDSSAPSWTASTYYKLVSTAGAPINFLIIHKPAVLQFTKHAVPKIISPENNPDADAWKYGYRNYGLCDAYENRRAGIYCSYNE